MARFIHLSQYGRALMLNVDNIVGVYPVEGASTDLRDDPGLVTTIDMTNGRSYLVMESVPAVMKILDSL